MRRLTQFLPLVLVLCLPGIGSASDAGQVSFFVSSGCPGGWVAADGSEVGTLDDDGTRETGDRWDFFDLVGGTQSFAPGLVIHYSGYQIIRLPDTRGMFLRGADLGYGRDLGRVVGSTQTDSFQGHKHLSIYTSAGPELHALGPSSSYGVDVSPFYEYAGHNGVSYPTSDSNYGTVRFSSETRPLNTSLVCCVKLTNTTGADMGIWSLMTGGDLSFFFGLLVGGVILWGYKSGAGH